MALFTWGGLTWLLLKGEGISGHAITTWECTALSLWCTRTNHNHIWENPSGLHAWIIMIGHNLIKFWRYNKVNLDTPRCTCSGTFGQFKRNEAHCCLPRLISNGPNPLSLTLLCGRNFERVHDLHQSISERYWATDKNLDPKINPYPWLSKCYLH